MPATQPLEIRTSPHLKQARSVEWIMLQVIFALIPIALFSIYQFGISVALLITTTTVMAMATERLFCWMGDRPSTLQDHSALLTGMLLALTLPPGFPLWMGAVAAIVAIAIGKLFFGGLGQNILNPALVGRAFVQAAFPVAITTWTPGMMPGRFLELIPTTLTPPLLQPPPIQPWYHTHGMDDFTGATPLALQKFEKVTTTLSDLFTGVTAGSAGETSFILIVLCGLYLAFRNLLDWRIPLGIFIATSIMALLTQWFDPTLPGPMFHILTGGLALGAFFMATDMVGSPVTPGGVWFYAFLIGTLTVVIRVYGGLTEGVMYAILLGNISLPLIEQVTQPRSYGSHR